MRGSVCACVFSLCDCVCGVCLCACVPVCVGFVCMSVYAGCYVGVCVLFRACLSFSLFVRTFVCTLVGVYGRSSRDRLSVFRV